jgi:phage terminase large subunit-like protein
MRNGSKHEHQTVREAVGALERKLERMYFNFQPRPDRMEDWDMQSSFYNSKHKGITFLLGGNGAGTTTLALAKAVKFLLRDQPPPRPATPFWIISEGYPMVMDVAWNEKLCGRGLLPEEEVQWDKIDWYKPNQNWPFRIPLKPWPDHDPNNYWVIELKSYDQGRSKMQASSIGGFVFIEQCPFSLIEEVLRGCRDYNYAGAKLAEFTPIDPHLSRPLEDMINNGSLPDDWAVYYCNTKCAMEAGHVSKEWFDEFFGLVSEEMREVRMRGAFASFEGLVYPTFNQRIHADDNLYESFTQGMYHYRSIDWGSGPENAFVCLWAAQDSVGTWYVYDEYYSTDQSMTYLDHAELIQRRHPWPNDVWHGPTYGDPASPGLARLFGQHGVPVSSANNQVLEGIESVRLALQLQNGDAKLIVDSKRCPNLLREMQTYVWEKSKGGKFNRNAAPRPLKRDDHSCDALRYLIHTTGQVKAKNSTSSSKIMPKNLTRFVK